MFPKFAERAYALALWFGGIGERKRIEAPCLVIARPVLQRATRCQCPPHMHATGKDAQEVSIIERDIDKHVVGQDGGIEEYKETMLEVSTVLM